MSRSVHAMILAAGRSRRMGRPKHMLPYGDGSIIEAIIEAVLESSVDALVVVANPLVEEFLRGGLPERCFIAINDDTESEMLRSVQVGLACIEEKADPSPDDGVLVLLGDQPEVSGGIITTVAEAYRLPRNPPDILVATYRGRRGHPTLFSVAALRQARDWGDDRRLNELLEERAGGVREIPIVCGPMPIDVNTPEDYDRLQGK